MQSIDIMSIPLPDLDDATILCEFVAFQATIAELEHEWDILAKGSAPEQEHVMRELQLERERERLAMWQRMSIEGELRQRRYEAEVELLEKQHSDAVRRLCDIFQSADVDWAVEEDTGSPTTD